MLSYSVCVCVYRDGCRREDGHSMENSLVNEAKSFCVFWELRLLVYKVPISLLLVFVCFVCVSVLKDINFFAF